MRIGALVLTLLLCIDLSYGQDFTNKGKDFWIGYGNHVRMFSPSMVPEKMQLYITSDQDASGSVDIAGVGFNQSFTVSANQITTIDIPRSAGLLNEGQYDLGIHVKADKPVVVYSFIYVNSVSGATVCLPTTTLGREYYSVNYTQVSNEANSYSYFFAVAADTGTTTIEITPSRHTLGGLAANTTYTYSLKQGQIYQVLSDLDLTGSIIKSVSSVSGGCKKIAVFSGSGKMSIGCGASAGTSDNLYQQVYPVSTWGKNYITVPSINNADRGGQMNYYRIFSSDPSALITLNGNAIGSLVGGQYYDFNNRTTNYIHSDKPILVGQYFTSGGCANNKGNGDPEMIYLNPVEQTISKVTLNSMQPASGTNINEHYINAVIPNAPSAINSFRIDGAAIASFSPVPQNNAFAYTQVAVTKGAHTISCDSGFNAIAYGFGSAESYGYSAGTNLKDLYQFISINNKYATVNFPAACRNSPFRFSMTFPYQPLQIQWIFSGLFTDTTINTPVYDSSWVVNGRQLYRYSLPRFYSIPIVGAYPIKVVANNPGVDGCGGQQEINYDLQVYDRPAVRFGYANNGCLTDPVLFSDTTDGGGRTIIHYAWDFGDGSRADSSHPIRLYASGGAYTVKFSVITDIGCLSDTAQKLVNLALPPTAAFSSLTANCLNAPTVLKDNSTAAAGVTLVKWYWNFGDSAALVKTDSGRVQHSYGAIKNFTASLQVETSTGCKSAVTTLPLSIHDLPRVDFASPAICLSDPVAQFYDSSSISDNSQAAFTYSWNFGNGSTDNTKNGKTSFTSAGLYKVKLTVTSKDGCARDTTKDFTVNGALPLAGFSVKNAGALCANQPVTITDASSVDFGSIIRVEIYWDYTNNPLAKTVDNAPAKGRTYSFLYPDFGSPASKSFQIKYVVYSGISCVNEYNANINLLASPQLRFDPLTPVCEELKSFELTEARDLSVFAATGVYSGKGIGSGKIFNPSQAGPGPDSIHYTVTAPNGCKADATQLMLVYPTPLVSAGDDKFLLEGGTVTLDGKASGDQLQLKWTPGNWLDNDAILTPRVSAPQDMNYQLSALSAKGCRASDEVVVKILRQIKVPNAFSPNGDGINDNWLIQYLDSYPGCSVDVYNRYGQSVFHSIGYGRPWDGTINGQPLPVGTYYWIINPKNGRSQVNGSVTIIR